MLKLGALTIFAMILLHAKRMVKPSCFLCVAQR
jgi:hypothetical protein